MVWIGIGGIALVLILLLLNAFAHARVERVRRILSSVAAASGILLLLALIWSGRGVQALWALALLAPMLVHLWRARRAARNFARGGQATPGGESVVETATLAMALHHDSGRMTGRVRRGRFAGADLADLARDQLLELLRDCAAEDEESVPLLEAWLDRAHPEWRETAGPTPPSPGAMTQAEAAQILGVAEDASEEEVQAAYRRLMRAAHPDQGGSDWMAARLNAARDFLLKS